MGLAEFCGGVLVIWKRAKEVRALLGRGHSMVVDDGIAEAMVVWFEVVEVFP